MYENAPSVLVHKQPNQFALQSGHADLYFVAVIIASGINSINLVAKGNTQGNLLNLYSWILFCAGL